MNGSVKKNGFTTLNRLLGKKNKDSTMSKSTSNLTRSMSQHENTSSQNNNNKIIPLSNMSNAPFEQTFRITVCLPQNQLFVTRLGAKTQLSVLLKMVCDNKDLDCNKYEFRHPADNSHAFHNELTIGLVGLKELRLVLKSEKYHNGNFNTDEMVNMKSVGGRNSTLSLDMTKNSRPYTKTTSPYSSTNSLNSMDSSGMSSSSRGGHPPIAPMRKKRAAPRPPSQNSIPEQHNEDNKTDINFNSKISEFKEPLPIMPRKNFFVSSPNLTNINESSRTLNNHPEMYDSNSSVNSPTIQKQNGHNVDRYSSVTDLNNVETNNSNNNRPVSMHILRHKNEIVTRPILNGGSSMTNINHSRTSSDSSEVRDGPEPIPRRRMFSGAKKKAPPAPPRGLPPVPLPREKRTEIGNFENAQQQSTAQSNETQDSNLIQQPTVVNVSKVMLNVDIADSHKEKTVPDDSLQTIESVNESVQLNHHDNNETILHTDEASINLNTESKSEALSECNKSKNDKIENNNFDIEKNISDNSVKTIVNDKIEVNIIENSCKNYVNTTVDTTDHISDHNVTKNPPSQSELELSSTDEKITDLPIINNLSELKNNSTDEKEIIIPVRKLSNKILEQRIPSPSSRSQSPLWTYTLPAPPKFADNNNLNTENVVTTIIPDDEKIYFNDDYMSSSVDNLTVISDSNTTYISDIDIKPIIQERCKINMDNNVLYNNNNDNNNKTIENNTTPSEIITSDIEDGYHGGDPIKFSRVVFIKNLEKRREQTIENEFEFLLNLDNEKNSKTDEKTKDANEKMNNEQLFRKSSNENDDDFVEEEKINTRTPEKVSDSNSNSSNININETMENTKNHVIEQLTTVINTNKIDNIIRKNPETSPSDHYFEDANRMSLSNFKMTTYTNNYKNIKSVDDRKLISGEEEFNEEDFINRRSFTDKKIVENKNQNGNKTEKEEEEEVFPIKPKEFIQIKRRSLTLNNNVYEPKSPSSRINRSGSFHSTRLNNLDKSEDTPDNVQRSSSYLSLITDQKLDGKLSSGSLEDIISNRRRSSSEQSISKSPSLQSLEIMKMILPSLTPKRQSINEENTDIEQIINKDTDDLTSKRSSRSISQENLNIEMSTHNNKRFVVEHDINIEVNDKKNSTSGIDINNHNEEEINRNDIKSDNNELTAGKEIKKIEKSDLNKQETTEHKWKYQGPPSIKLASWNERKKIDVSIKSDRDYKFGGGSALTRNYENNFVQKSPVIVKAPQTNNTENQQNVESVHFRNSQVNVDKKEENLRLPFVRSVEYKKSIDYNQVACEENNNNNNNVTTENISTKPEICQKPNFYSTFSRPVSMQVGSRSGNSNTILNNRFSGSAFNHNKFNPVVRGFKPDTVPKESNQFASVTNINTKNSNEQLEEIQNCVTISHNNRNNTTTNTNKITNNVKIIENNESRPNHINTTFKLNSTLKHSTHEVPKIIEENILPFSQNTLRRTGLKEKIIAAANNEKPKNNSLTNIIPTQIHLKQQQETFVKSKYSENNINNFTTTVPPPPPPKMAPIIRNVFPKKQISNENDSHDQLLLSIRNFNKTALKRS